MNPDASLQEQTEFDMTSADWRVLEPRENCSGNAAQPQSVSDGGQDPRKFDRSIYCLDHKRNKAELVHSTMHS